MSRLGIDDQGFIKQRRLPDRWLLAVDPLVFGRARLGIGPNHPLENAGVFNDTWEFPDITSALAALDNWNPEESPEPDGWDRHVDTGRYRILGQKEMEYVKFDGSIDNQVRHAVHVTQGSDRVIEEIRDDSHVLGPTFPNGTKLYQVISTSTECPHKSPCKWHDNVYHYLGRCVILPLPASYNVTVGCVLRRLVN